MKITYKKLKPSKKLKSKVAPKSKAKAKFLPHGWRKKLLK